MRQNGGLSRSLRWQNNRFRLVALYSSPLSSFLTAKLMVVGCDSTPSSANRRVSSG